MRKRIAVLQPGYLPWLGYFDQLARVDLFVHYDDVQYTRRDWRNRNRVKGPTGPVWLTVPVASKGQRETLICDVQIANQEWQRKHLATVERFYRRCAHFEAGYALLEKLLTQRWDRLCELCIAGTELLARELGIATPTIRSSELSGCAELTKSDRLIAICRQLGATEYLSGSAARAYLDVEAFRAAGIEVLFQEYQHPEYPQAWGEFTPYLSVVDLLMNTGRGAREVVLSSPGPTPAAVVCG